LNIKILGVGRPAAEA